MGFPRKTLAPVGPVTGGSMVNFMGNAVVQAYANEIAQEEHKHVQFLRAAYRPYRLHDSRPALNLSTSFATAAVAAGLERASPTRTQIVSSAEPTYSRT